MIPSDDAPAVNAVLNVGLADAEEAFRAWCDERAAGGARVTVLSLYGALAEARGVRPHDLPLGERRALALRAFALIWPGFEVLPDAERLPEPVEIVAYDPAWPALFGSWRERLAGALGVAALRIEHVGSTSVAGLAAKPIIDIQLSVARIDDEASYVPACETTGLQLRNRDEEHRYLRPAAGKPRQIHLHVCQVGSGWERVHVLFRDYLRTNHAARSAYSAMKYQAAADWRDDRIAYTEAKTELILDLLASAERWAATTGWGLPTVS